MDKLFWFVSKREITVISQLDKRFGHVTVMLDGQKTPMKTTVIFTC